MGAIEDIQAQLGEEFFTTRRRPSTRSNWSVICVCGHPSRYHAASIGGVFEVPAEETILNRGEEWTKVVVFAGCVGALKPRGFEEETTEANQTDRVVTRTIHVTCGCVEFRPVAEIDRVNRFFCQRVPLPASRGDFTRHAFQVGIKAFRTHLSKRRAALSDPTWPDAEFNRRFRWLDTRVCGISKCRETDGVLPVYVNGAEGGDRSELRCPQHRPG